MAMEQGPVQPPGGEMPQFGPSANIVCECPNCGRTAQIPVGDSGILYECRVCQYKFLPIANMTAIGVPSVARWNSAPPGAANTPATVPPRPQSGPFGAGGNTGAGASPPRPPAGPFGASPGQPPPLAAHIPYTPGTQAPPVQAPAAQAPGSPSTPVGPPPVVVNIPYTPGMPPPPGPGPSSPPAPGESSQPDNASLKDWLRDLAKKARASVQSPTGQMLSVMGGSGNAYQIGRAISGDPVAAVQFVKDLLVGSIRDMVGGIGRAATAERGEGMLGGVGQALWGAGKLSMVAPGGVAFAPGLQAVGLFTTALAAGVEKLRDWNAAIEAGNFRFADYSASMANVQARQEVREIHMSRERGNRRAEAAEEHAKARHRLDKALAPYEDMVANLRSRGTAMLSNAVAAPLEWATRAEQAFNRWGSERSETFRRFNEWATRVLGGNGVGDTTGLGAFFADQGNAAWMEHYGDPANFAERFGNHADIRRL